MLDFWNDFNKNLEIRCYEDESDKKDEESTWAKLWKEVHKNLKMGCCEEDSDKKDEESTGSKLW